MKRIILTALVLICALAGTASAQQTGIITGRVVDAQGSAVPGVTVTATQANTGLVRSVVSDGEGIYRLNGMPVGSYELKAEITGFAPWERKAIIVNVAQTTDLNIDLKLAGMSEAVQVTAESPLVKTTDSSVGGVVDVSKIESLPLNGRQFANLAMTIPGVGLGFHSDPTKSTQYSPQIAGGNGRNVNYQIDGGDNNDDTVGGLLQLFPLEAIQEFNFVTQRYKAEYGRSNGGVMNIVTKSGTNNFKGSWFTSMRDKSLNAQTFTEKINKVEKQDYRRYQYGGSFGGPVVQNKAHFFVAAERTQQDTKQAVTTLGLFPSLDGVYNTPNRETLFTGKFSTNLNAQQFLSVRYGRNTNSQVYGAGTRSVPDSWGDSVNKFNSINANHNWVLPGGKLNEFVFQYADFDNHVAARTGDPQQTFPNGVSIGYNSNTPQTTIQHKFQFRDDFSWHQTGMGGLGHDFKAGINYIHEPKLYVTFASGSTDYAYGHLTNDINGPISGVSRSKEGASANLPMNQYGFYIQDDWRLTDRLTVNAGLRYDLVTGFLIDQLGKTPGYQPIPNYIALTTAAAAGRFNGVPGFEEFGKKAQEDKNNIQPRIGAVWDLHGDGTDVVRAGWGIYYDYGFTNANILFPGLSAQGGSGTVFSVSNTAGIKNPDGSFFAVGQPISNIASQNEVNPNGPFYSSNVAAPQIRQPWTTQASIGWSHQLAAATVLDIDYVSTRGHDLGVRWPLNTRINNGARRYADLNLNPANPTMNMSVGKSRFDGLNLGVRQRMTHGVQVNAWYSLSRADGLGGLGVDELTTNLVQDSTNPFADVQYGPAARTDARHKVTVSAVIQAPWGISISPIYRFRSALPLHIWYGYDNNLDGVSNDKYTTAYRFTGVDDAGNPSFEEMGACDNINCGRGASQSQMNLRVSKQFKLPGTMGVELFGEVFNMFNAKNPAFGVGSASSTRYYTGTLANHTINPVFLKPTAYAGDAGQPEQRVGQIGFRFVF
jgi:outer membrane receptor protein involved in Fe transport